MVKYYFLKGTPLFCLEVLFYAFMTPYTFHSQLLPGYFTTYLNYIHSPLGSEFHEHMDLDYFDNHFFMWYSILDFQ